MSYYMVKSIGGERQNFNEFQIDLTGYMLDGVIWTSSNEVRNTWWFLQCSRLKILVKSVELIFRSLAYDKVNVL